MKPRKVTQEDAEFWSAGNDKFTIGPMLGRHVGAEDIPTVLKGNCQGQMIVKVAWVLEERDNISGLREGLTVWTTFWGGMIPSDVVIV